MSERSSDQGAIPSSLHGEAIGLASLLALIAHAAKRTWPLHMPRTAAGVIRLAAGLGLLNGLVYQGLGGSFEDARHLWFAFGLLIASARIEVGTNESRPTPPAGAPRLSC